jgi:3-phenylpropionate/trans-cinnamate dioxygenase ferredoxin subunit
MQTPGRLIAVGSLTEFPPGRLRSVVIGDDEYLVLRLGEAAYALSNRCTHMGCFLSEGLLRDHVVTCTCHGSKFDVRSGAVVDGPAEEPVPTYPVVIQAGKVHLRL